MLMTCCYIFFIAMVSPFPMFNIIFILLFYNNKCSSFPGQKTHLHKSELFLNLLKHSITIDINVCLPIFVISCD